MTFHGYQHQHVQQPQALSDVQRQHALDRCCVLTLGCEDATLVWNSLPQRHCLGKIQCQGERSLDVLVHPASKA